MFTCNDIGLRITSKNLRSTHIRCGIWSLSWLLCVIRLLFFLFLLKLDDGLVKSGDVPRMALFRVLVGFVHCSQFRRQCVVFRAQFGDRRFVLGRFAGDGRRNSFVLRLSHRRSGGHQPSRFQSTAKFCHDVDVVASAARDTQHLQRQVHSQYSFCRSTLSSMCDSVPTIFNENERRALLKQRTSKFVYKKNIYCTPNMT